VTTPDAIVRSGSGDGGCNDSGCIHHGTYIMAMVWFEAVDAVVVVRMTW
jgi:hypothetical protein